MLDETAAASRVASCQPAGALTPHADRATGTAGQHWSGDAWREWYHHLIQADAHGDARLLATRLVNHTFARAARDAGPPCLACHGADWRTDSGLPDRDTPGQRSRWQAILDRLPPHRQALWLVPLAPSLLADGCWLQHASSALNSHEAVTAPLLRSYLARGLAARAMAEQLRLRGISFPPIGSDAFAQEPEVDAAMYALPALGMALSQFPTLLLPELLGFNLVMAREGGHVLLQLLGAIVGAPDDSLLALAVEAVEAEPDVAPERIGRGIQVARMLLEERNSRLDEMARQGWFEAPGRMARLLQHKAAVAMGYHARVRAGEGTLDARFAMARRDPRELLQWLAQSTYVVPGRPEESRLVASLASPRGSMAGVLAPHEIDIVRDWIRTLSEQGACTAAWQGGAVSEPEHLDFASDDPILPLPLDGASHDDRLTDLPLRELYFRLLHLERHPELLPYAYRFAQLWLARAGLGLEKGDQRLPFSPFTHRSFADWLAQRHAAQLQGHVDAGTTPAPSREELIASCVQLCPMVYIDGAWLQRIGQVGLRDSPVAAKLQAIYLDEVGGGDPRENHPNLYRELMEAMGVEMPPFGTRAFAHWAGFEDASFRLPVMWLCLSQFPRQFMPELLGFNLAVELSGVGGSYRTSSDALRRYGYPSTFVDVHNTIDNITSGHTALAFDAIRLHLDETMDHGGPDEVQRRWKRVWTGWRAIVPPAGMVWN